jgi:hypothetical protein
MHGHTRQSGACLISGPVVMTVATVAIDGRDADRYLAFSSQFNPEGKQQ